MSTEETTEEKELLSEEREKLLKAKEERFLDKEEAGEEEEKEKKEKPDTPFNRFLTKVGFIWDYYKWHIIIPTAIVIITVSIVYSFIDDGKERALELSIMNAYEVGSMVYELDQGYTAYTEGRVTDEDIRVEMNLMYPDPVATGEGLSESDVASMQKFNAMVLAGRVDVAVTNFWVADAYSLTDSTLDLREIFDEEVIENYADRFYYATGSTGEKVPVGIYLTKEVFIDCYDENSLPMVVSFDTSKHLEEVGLFLEWILENE